ncbi:unnamed protein product [Penicillium olsonii]|uniref:Centromere protein X n=1 Tax=Penicillium olsonii TaxID=99116 RepID=A0A9W4HES1_PENOL|nr:unnamed protein product [Penicillium olsonii]CAG8059487.1 unnamed protein product [Penicillium olsonii]
MPGEPKPAQKRPRLPFKPPTRTSAGASSAPKAKGKAKQTSTKVPASNTEPSTTKTSQFKPTKSSTAKRPRVESPAPDEVQSGSESGSDAPDRSRSQSLSQEPDYILAEITTTNPVEDVNSSDPKIPPKLLTRLLHEHFQNDKTKIAKDANNVVAKYVDVFVREAIARAAFERAETNNNADTRRIGDGFLEVEDLEKMAPQLTMDF